MTVSSQLNRTLGLRVAIIVVMSNIIGSGVYKKVAPMVGELHSSGWVLICWLLGGLITLMGALCNAEIASMLADTGGEYTYYKKIYGRFFSFLYGWSNFAAIKTAAIASIAYVFAQSFQSMVQLPPILSSWSDWHIGGIFYPFEGFEVKLVAILLIALLTWVNTTGLKTGAGLSTVLMILVVAGILLIVGFGSSSPEAQLSSAFSLETPPAKPVTVSAVFTAMLAAFWAYEGWNSVGFIGGEIKNPNRNVPLSITIGLLLVISLYFIVNMTYLAVMPIQDMEIVNSNTNQIAAIEVMRVFSGSTGVFLISILILLTTLGCTHATILSNARTYYAMSNEKLFFRWIGNLNKAKVPGNSLWFQCIWAGLLVLSGTFDQLTDMLIFAAFIYYGATTLGVFILRKKMPDASRPYKVWGYPVVPALFILFCVILVVNTLIQRPREAGIGLALILLGVPLYGWFNRRKKN